MMSRDFSVLSPVPLEKGVLKAGHIYAVNPNGYIIEKGWYTRSGTPLYYEVPYVLGKTRIPIFN